MPRLKSRTGCLRCKTQRKKCPEERPRCSTCVRLEIECVYGKTPSYQPQHQRLTTLGVVDMGSPSSCPKLLPLCKFQKGSHETQVGLVPSLVTALCGHSPKHKDNIVSSLMQLVVTKSYVRDAFVAFGSMCLPMNRGRKDSFDRACSARASRTVRLMLNEKNIDKPTLFCLQIAIGFIAASEDIEHDPVTEPASHLRGVALLVREFRHDFDRRHSYVPESLYMFVLESFTYLATQAIFMRCDDALSAVPKHAAVLEILTSVAPGPELRAQDSPLISGQYEVYHVALEITVLLRSHAPRSIFQTKLDDLQQRTSKIRSELTQSIDDNAISSPEQRETTIFIYDAFCRSILICILALRPPSPLIAPQISHLANRILQRFLRKTMVWGFNAPLLWVLHILACAVVHDEDHRALIGRFRQCIPVLGLLQLASTERVFVKTQEIRGRAVTPQESELRAAFDDDHLPRCMLLLRQKDGILASEF